MEPAVGKSPDAPSRSDRRVAGRDRRVACATLSNPAFRDAEESEQRGLGITHRSSFFFRLLQQADQLLFP
jgi:hypothetical protein